MTPVELGTGLVTVVAVAVTLWWVDRAHIRTAAKKIDAHYRGLRREPRWVEAIPASEVPAAVTAKLDQWDALCQRELGLRPLGRLAEYAESDFLGVRTVLLDPSGGFAATLACSHVNPAISFRGLASKAGGRFVLTVDAKSPSSPPDQVVVTQLAKTATERAMVEAHLAAVQRVGEAVPFADMAQYVDFQTELWQAGHAHRTQQGYLIDLESLQRLAPPQMSAARLAKIHAAIVALHQSSPRG